MPDFNRVVVAHLVGGTEHSGVSWRREGYAFMVRHQGPEHVVADNWARSFYEDALAKLGASYLTVECWAYLDDVRAIMKPAAPATEE